MRSEAYLKTQIKKTITLDALMKLLIMQKQL